MKIFGRSKMAAAGSFTQSGSLEPYGQLHAMPRNSAARPNVILFRRHQTLVFPCSSRNPLGSIGVAIFPHPPQRRGEAPSHVSPRIAG